MRKPLSVFIAIRLVKYKKTLLSEKGVNLPVSFLNLLLRGLLFTVYAIITLGQVSGYPSCRARTHFNAA